MIYAVMQIRTLLSEALYGFCGFALNTLPQKLNLSYCVPDARVFVGVKNGFYIRKIRDNVFILHHF